jgi:processed acidic surface protein
MFFINLQTIPLSIISKWRISMVRKISALILFGLIFLQLGTPIANAAVTDTEVNEILAEYDLSREELDVILAEYGTSIDEHESKQELANAVDFYLNHLSVLKDLEEFLASIGITEEEADRLFDHLEKIDSDEMQQQMVAIDTRIEEVMMASDSEFSDTEREELSSLFTEMMNVMQLDPTFYLVDSTGENTAISYEQLLQAKEFTSDALLVQLNSTTGELLADVELTNEMLSGDFVLSAFEKVADVGELVAELPDTASFYGTGILLGLILALSGFGLFIIRKKTTSTLK